MRKLIAVCAALTTILVLAGVAMADDPNGDIQRARDLLAQADAILAAEQANPPVVQTVTQTVTETVTASPPTTTTPPPPPPTTTTPPPTTTTTAPPPSGFPSRAEALARPNVVVKTGAQTAQFNPTSTDTTYDFRTASWQWPNPTAYPIVIEGTRNVAIGGTVAGTQGRTLTWEQVHDVYGGYGGRMFTNDYSVWYDFRVDNVTDGLGFDLLPACGSLPGPTVCEFLVDTAYMTWIRDDGIEVDQPEFSGTIRDVLMDGVNNAFSFGQSTKNPNAITNISDVLIVHAVMNNGHAADGAGHQTIFKQAPGGRVNMTNVTDCLYENPITPSRIGIRPPGTWTNVTFILGPGWVGADPNVPAGATVSRDWQGKCVNAAAAWRAAHGY